MSDERRKVLEALLAAKEKEADDARLHDPLTFYNETPIEKYWYEDLGEYRRLGPGPTQLQALLSTKTFRMVEGGNRSGKTVHALVEVGMYARNLHPVRKWTLPPRILILITTRKQAKMVWQKRLFERSEIFGPAYDFPIIPQSEIADKKKTKDIDYTYAGSEKIMTRVALKNGAEIFFYWAGAAQAWQNIEGVTFDAVVRDESTKDMAGNEQMMTEIKMRLFDSQCHPVKKREFAGWLLWVSTATKPSVERDEYKEMALSGDESWGYFLLTSDDNPMITKEDREKAAKSMSEEDAAVRLWGSESYDSRFMVLRKFFDQERAVFKKSYFPVPTDNLWACIDPAFGRTGSKHGIVLVAISEESPDVYKVLCEDSKRNCSVSDQVDILLQMMASFERSDLEGMVMDPAARKTESTGQSVYSQYIAEILRRQVKVHRGQVVLGRNRKEDVYPMLQTVLQRNRVLINPECTQLVKQINECRTKEPTVYSGPRGVIDKHLDVLKSLQYFVSRGIVWVDRGVAKRAKPSIAAHWDPVQDGWDTTGVEDEDMKVHVNRLKTSSLIAERMTRRSVRKGYLPVIRMS